MNHINAALLPLAAGLCIAALTAHARQTPPPAPAPAPQPQQVQSQPRSKWSLTFGGVLGPAVVSGNYGGTPTQYQMQPVMPAPTQSQMQPMQPMQPMPNSGGMYDPMPGMMPSTTTTTSYYPMTNQWNTRPGTPLTAAEQYPNSPTLNPTLNKTNQPFQMSPYFQQTTTTNYPQPMYVDPMYTQPVYQPMPVYQPAPMYQPVPVTPIPTPASGIGYQSGGTSVYVGLPSSTSVVNRSETTIINPGVPVAAPPEMPSRSANTIDVAPTGPANPNARVAQPTIYRTDAMAGVMTWNTTPETIVIEVVSSLGKDREKAAAKHLGRVPAGGWPVRFQNARPVGNGLTEYIFRGLRQDSQGNFVLIIVRPQPGAPVPKLFERQRATVTGRLAEICVDDSVEQAGILVLEDASIK